MAGVGSVAQRLAGLTPQQRDVANCLRTLATKADSALAERIKWNAPSFAKGDADRITLGLARDGKVRVVLHRGAKVKDATGFAFTAPAELVSWPATDRGVMQFASLAEVAAREDEIGDIFRRWLETE